MGRARGMQTTPATATGVGKSKCRVEMEREEHEAKGIIRRRGVVTKAAGRRGERASCNWITLHSLFPDADAAAAAADAESGATKGRRAREGERETQEQGSRGGVDGDRGTHVDTRIPLTFDRWTDSEKVRNK